MIEYQIVRNHETHEIYLIGDYPEGSLLISIPKDCIHRKLYISLFLHKKDIDAAIDFLNCMKEDNPYRMNEGLFIAALSLYFKCFQESQARIELKGDEFKIFSPTCKDVFEIFKAWRNKHYIHDENGMNQAEAFFIVSPDDREKVFVGPASVIWQSAYVDHMVAKKDLSLLLSETRRFVCKRIDEIGDQIMDIYKDLSREDVLSFGEVSIPDANLDFPKRKRQV